MSFFSPSRLSANAKIALFEQDTSCGGIPRRRNKLAMTPSSDAAHPREQLAFVESSSRLPLSFLSPNRNHAKNHKPTPFLSPPSSAPTPACRKLQRQVEELRDKILGGAINADDLLQMVNDTTLENGAKEEQPSQLQAKLHSIQSGLDDIEQERQSLTSKAYRLENEKISIQKELQQREKEISCLSRRCSAQADKMKEAIKLQSINRELSKQVSDLEERLSVTESEGVRFGAIEQELEQIRQERDDLQQRLTSVEKDHDGVADKLRQCLSNLERLTEEKQAWEDERRRLEQRAELERDQQRLEHKQSLMELQEDLARRCDSIDRLERSLRDKASSLNEMRVRIADMERAHASKLEELESLHQQTIEQVREEFSSDFEQAQAIFEEEIDHLQSELDSKSSMLTVVEKDLAVKMGQLMVATQSLQKAEEQSAMFESLTADIECLEQERFRLSELLHERDTELAELSAEILKLEIENSFATGGSAPVSELQDRLMRLEQAKASLEHASSQQREKAQATIEALQSSLEDALERHRQFVGTLQANHQRVIADYESKLGELDQSHSITAVAVESKEAVVATLNESLRECGERICRLQEEVDLSRSENAFQIENLRAQHSKEIADVQATIETLQLAAADEASFHKRSLEAKESTVVHLKKALQEAHEELAAKQTEHEEVQLLMQQELRATRSSLMLKEDELRDLRVIEIAEYEEKLAAATTQAASLTGRLQAAQAELRRTKEDYESQIARLRSKMEENDVGRVKDSQDAVQAMTLTVANLRNELDDKEATIRSQERRFKEASADLSILSQRLSKYEKEVVALRIENRRLCCSETDVQAKLAVYTQTIEKEIERRELAEAAKTDAEALRSSAELELRSCEGKVVAQQEQMAALEQALHERTHQLDEMISDNKLLEEKMTERNAELSGLAEQNEGLQVELSEASMDGGRARAEWSKREDEYLAELADERLRRELAEADLVALRSTQDCARQAVRDSAELEKENQALKVKIRRQEAYMKRKLDKEKALRERSNPLKTPARSGIQPPRVRSATINRGSRSTRSTVASDVSSLDWELDSILADYE